MISTDTVPPPPGCSPGTESTGLLRRLAAPVRMPALAVVVSGLACLAALVGPGSGAAAAVPEPQVDLLDNGLRLVTVHDPATPLTQLSLWWTAGRAHNPRSREGLADLAARCDARRVLEAIRAGTVGRPYMAEALDVRVSADHIRFGLAILPEHLDAGMAVLRALVPAADEPFAAASTLKRTALGGILRNRDNPKLVAQEAFTAASCGMRRPLGQSATFASVYGLGSEQVAEFHARYCVPSAFIVSIAGATSRAAGLDAVRQHFGDWPAGDMDSAPWARSPEQPPYPGIFLIDDPNAEQAVVLGGFTGPGRESDRYPDLQLLHLLMSSGQALEGVRRITAADRQAHEFFGQLRPSARGALLTVTAVVDHSSAVATLEMLRATIDGDSLVAMSDAYLEGLLEASRNDQRLADEDVAQATAWRLPFLIAGRSLVDPGLLSPIDLEAWRAYVRRIVAPGRLCWVIVGRADALAPGLEASGLVVTRAGNLDVVVGQFPPADDDDSSPLFEDMAASSADIAAAEELLLAALDARGGFEMLDRIESYRADYTLLRKLREDMTVKSQRTVRVRFPDHFREDWGMEVPSAGDTAQEISLVQVINGDQVWRRQLTRERAASERRERQLRFRLWSDELRVLQRYGEPGTRIRLVEPEVLAGITAPGLQIDSPEGYWVRLYFHPESNHIVKRVYQRSGDRAPILVEELFTDYREVGGVFLPFRSAVTEAARIVGEDHLDSIEYNVELPDALFERSHY
ncbi:MAG: insulinase family protein [Candidatus Eiseniibacteriota bacterium]